MNFGKIPMMLNKQDPKQSGIVQDARDAAVASSAFGMPMTTDMGRWANILPAAIQIEEHKKMAQVAADYQDKYVKDFKEKYGFKEGDLKHLEEEFDAITTHITELIPDTDMKKMYTKYVKSYPHMYLSMIPAEALQSKLAVKCVTENRILRAEIEKMSTCVSTLVQGLTNLQKSAGIPPIVNLMFESMPDPLTAITDPMYHNYNDAIGTYHLILNKDMYKHDLRKAPSVTLDTIRTAIGNNPRLLTREKHPTDDTKDVYVTVEEIDTLKTVITNMGTQSGCQPYGDEWNHTGPEPAMNPAMCMSGGDNMKAGNPRNDQGRNSLYQAVRTQDGGARWVLKGQVPGVTGQTQQMMQHHQPQQYAPSMGPQGMDPWAGYAHQPGVNARKAPRKSSKKSSKKGKKSSK